MATAPASLHTLRGHTAGVHTVCFKQTPKKDDTGNVLISGDTGGNLKVWDLERRRPVVDIHAHEKGILEIISVPTNSCFVSQGRDGSVNLWDLHTVKTIGKVATGSYGFCRAVFSASDTRKVYTCGSEPTDILCCDTSKAKVAQRLSVKLPAAGGMCMALAPVPGSHILLAAYESGCVAGIELRTGAVAFHERISAKTLLSMDVSKGGRGVCAGADDSIQFFDVDTDKLSLVVRTKLKCPRPGVGTVAVRPDRKIMASGGWDHRVRVFQWKRPKPLAILKEHKGSVHCVRFSADSRLMASGSKDTNIKLWSLYAPK